MISFTISPTRLLRFSIFPPCTFIWPCSFIRHIRVSYSSFNLTPSYKRKSPSVSLRLWNGFEVAWQTLPFCLFCRDPERTGWVGWLPLPPLWRHSPLLLWQQQLQQRKPSLLQLGAAVSLLVWWAQMVSPHVRKLFENINQITINSYVRYSLRFWWVHTTLPTKQDQTWSKAPSQGQLMTRLEGK